MSLTEGMWGIVGRTLISLELAGLSGDAKTHLFLLVKSDTYRYLSFIYLPFSPCSFSPSFSPTKSFSRYLSHYLSHYISYYLSHSFTPTHTRTQSPLRFQYLSSSYSYRTYIYQYICFKLTHTGTYARVRYITVSQAVMP